MCDCRSGFVALCVHATLRTVRKDEVPGGGAVCVRANQKNRQEVLHIHTKVKEGVTLTLDGPALLPCLHLYLRQAG